MKIGIIGTRGIPNCYGGYEQFVEYAAPMLVNRGHEVYVYNSSLHPVRQKTWKGVHLVRRFDPENKIGTAGQFIYDLNCILDARKRNFDVMLQLGYTSSSVWSFLFPKNSVVVTNMDGLEWKRQQYSKPVRRFLKQAEKWAALYSHYLIADSRAIQNYLMDVYGKPSAFIAYGATLMNKADEQALRIFGLEKYGYDLLVSRMEPENNVELIIQAHLMAQPSKPLIIAGNHRNKFGTYLHRKYAGEKIRFIGPVFNIEVLNNLRFYSHLYFHGHSVGGTNPSLLEAMASHALIVAHDNVFNKAVLGQDAFYFSSLNQLAEMLNRDLQREEYASLIQKNAEKITLEYSWPHIVDLLESYLRYAVDHADSRRLGALSEVF
jgi:glycosyltransferase involved in cell wall biosynthesis